MSLRTATIMRPNEPLCRALWTSPGPVAATMAAAARARSSSITQRAHWPPPPSAAAPKIRRRHLHTDTPTPAWLSTSARSPSPARGGNRDPSGGDEAGPGRSPTDLGALDVLAGAPAPATAVDACLPDGFRLNSGIAVRGGSGMLLVNGEAFSWRPWEGGAASASSSSSSPSPSPPRRLVNAKGQWEVDPSAFGMLSLLWPRPDLLVLGLGPEMRPLSPATRRCISGLGVRVEVLDTRNAAAQFNLLATERGVGDVAAALIPFGWREGRGAV